MKIPNQRILALILTFTVLMTLTPTTGLASGTDHSGFVVTVETASASAGDSVNVGITVEDNPGVLGMTLSITFDEGLTLADAKSGSAFTGLSMTKPGHYSSPCRFVWDGQELDPDEIKDGVILTLTFRVAPDAEVGKVYAIRAEAHLPDEQALWSHL